MLNLKQWLRLPQMRRKATGRFPIEPPATLRAAARHATALFTYFLSTIYHHAPFFLVALLVACQGRLIRAGNGDTNKGGVA
ncbi:uncharacterized protein BDR25DRAFT_108751 [Lindgomyces ingoldianus]|uniref:Uncharacterized protein n=1 Tax=Lindgomyces ingoldianus TaxID=673940 RepID=A0ACB6Q8V4_9PLEO|nr:uncharacterized protein BDR25DRAFT_108751 [Lindgomyces ingoldianus]KAF2463469.1 hypothetical protein BDR25DRAFT_108751 [Lindgomyces ingoldianus]